MGTLYKQQFTKPLPEGAELVERRGEKLARWRDRHGRARQAPVTTGDDGNTRLLCESAVWSARYRDHDGRLVQQSTGCRDRDAASQVLAGWEREAERIRAGIATPKERDMAR